MEEEPVALVGAVAFKAESHNFLDNDWYEYDNHSSIDDSNNRLQLIL